MKRFFAIFLSGVMALGAAGQPQTPINNVRFTGTMNGAPTSGTLDLTNVTKVGFGNGNVTAAGNLTAGDAVIGAGLKALATSSVFQISGANATVNGNLSVTNTITTSNVTSNGTIDWSTATFSTALKVAGGGTGLTGTTFGNIIVGNNTTTFGQVAVGANGRVITANSSAPLGVSWETPAVGTGNVTNNATLTSGNIVVGGGTTVVGTSNVAISGNSMTVPNAITANNLTVSNNGTVANLTISNNATVGNTITALNVTSTGTIDWSAATFVGPVPIGNGGTTLTGTTLGNIVLGNNSVTFGQLAVGGNGKVVTANSSAPLGVSWETPASGTGNVTSSGTPTSGQMAQFSTATNIIGVGTTGSGNVVLSPGGVTITTGKVLGATNNLTLTATDGSTLAVGTGGTLGTAAYTAASAYTASAVVPSTVPSAGNILVGNAGGTAYAPVAMSGDAALASTGAVTLGTVNSNVGTFGNATTVPTFTVNAKGLVTAVTNSTITGGGNVTGGSLTDNHIVLGNGTTTIGVVAGLGTSTTVLHGAAAGPPTFGAIVNSDITAGTIDLTTKVTGILPAANGGTANGFTAISGPATSTKTFTLPNASSTILTDNAAVTVAQGGTGLATLTAHAVLTGNGTGTLTSVSPGTTGNVLKSNGTDWTSGTVTAAPAGSDTQIQYNSSGSLAATANFTLLTASGPVQMLSAGTANTSQDGYAAINPGTASSGNQMYGPRFKMRGSGWHTVGTASSQVVDWALENRPQEGTGNNNPYALLAFQVNVHTSGFTDALTIFSGVNTVSTLAPTIVTVNTSRSDSSPRIDYASGGTTTVYTGAAASGQTITAGASAGDFVIMPATTGKKLALSFDVGSTVGTSISSTGVTTTGGFQSASGNGVTFGASGGSIIGTSGDVTIASSGSTKDININPTTLGYVVFNNGSNARGLKINNTGGSNPIEFQMSGTTKGVIAIPNAANNWITGSVQYDMTFVNAASQSFLFSTDNGTSIALKLGAGNGNISTEKIGVTFAVKSGSNAKSGTFTLASGVVTVSNTSVTANSVIVATCKTSSGTLGLFAPEIVLNAGVGFSATGAVTDNSVYNFMIFEVN